MGSNLRSNLESDLGLNLVSNSGSKYGGQIPLYLMLRLIFFRFLDREAANQEVENPKKAKAMQEKAQKDAAKLLKNFKKIQKKADKINNKDIRNLDREIERLGIMNNGESSDDLGIDSNSNSSGSNAAPKFSEITSSSGNGSENSRLVQSIVEAICSKNSF